MNVVSENRHGFSPLTGYGTQAGISLGAKDRQCLNNDLDTRGGMPYNGVRPLDDVAERTFPTSLLLFGGRKEC